MRSLRQAILASWGLGQELSQRRKAFRRRGCAKVSSAAEVLEPRYVLTHDVGLPEDDPASEPGTFVVEPSQWDGRGLTLQQVGDWLHVFHTGTRTDVIEPMLVAEISSLRLIGRENVSDVLTWDLSFGTTVDLASYWPHIALLHFDGGGGAGRDEIRLINSANSGNWVSDTFGFIPRADRSGLWTIEGMFRGSAGSEEPDSEWQWISTGLDYADVELLRDTLVCGLAASQSDASFGRSVSFGDEDNDVLLDWRGRDGLARLTDSATGLNVQLAAQSLVTNPEDDRPATNRMGWAISAGNGDDRVIVKKSNSQPWGNPYDSNYLGIDGGQGNDFIDISQSDRAMNVFGGSDWDGTDAGEQIRDNDTLVGSDYSDDLWGGAGDDLLLGGRGDDWLRVGNGSWAHPRGDDTLDGGPGCDRLWNDTTYDTELTLTTHRLEGAGTTILRSIEIGGLLYWGDEDVKYDASGFDGFAVLQGGGGHDTLIGGPYQDDLGNWDGDGGPDLIEERGVDSFGWPDSEHNEQADEEAVAESSSALFVIDVDELETEAFLADDSELIDQWLAQESLVTNLEDVPQDGVIAVSQLDGEDSDFAPLDEPGATQEIDPLGLADPFSDDLALGELLLSVLDPMESESQSDAAT
ncbi:MAG: hypothetical protein IAG10_03705 [Planctomycetaceae bacterium]|nr:hypothetical protein [Planctomycetaceae bacterium]